MDIPRSLRLWFLAHFVVDYMVAVPLFVFPVQSLFLLGFSPVDPLATRLVAAALLAIGGVSLGVKNSGPEAFKILLNLKIIWSGAALLAIALTAFEGKVRAPAVAVIFSIFAIFFCVWVYYRLKFNTCEPLA